MGDISLLSAGFYCQNAMMPILYKNKGMLVNRKQMAALSESFPPFLAAFFLPFPLHRIFPYGFLCFS